MPNGTVRLAWGDGDYDFNIAKIKHILELEEKCGAGIGAIYDRVRSQMGDAPRWYFNDLRETLRLGLIGGGMEPPRALMLVQRYCDDRPLSESLKPALAVLLAAMVGIPGDEVGKKARRSRPRRRPTQVSSAPSSTASAPQSDSRHEKSTSSPFGSSPPASTA